MNYTFLDKEYISKLASKLRNFTVVSYNPYRVNFSCPYCGDSKKDPNKRRAWLIEQDSFILFNCFNCGTPSTNFYNFLKFMDPDLWKEYKLELFREKNKSTPRSIKKVEKFIPRIEKNPIQRKEKFDPLKDELIVKISSLPEDHKGKRYIEGRKIPSHKHYLIYYTKAFRKWVNKYNPDTFKDVSKDEERIVFPFIDEKGYVFAVAGRALDPKSSLRYITVKFDQTKQKIYGLNTLDPGKEKIYVTEGQIDSLFLDNCISFAGSDGVIDKYFSKSKLVIILDNEPRNKEIVDKYKKFVDNDFSIVLWPKYMLKYGKDINDYVLNSGLEIDQIKKIIDQNTYKGLMAQMKFKEWKKWTNA